MRRSRCAPVNSTRCEPTLNLLWARGRGAQRPYQKKATGSAQPGRLNGQRPRGSGRLLEGSHAAQTAPAFALRHVTQRLEERAVVAVFDVAAHGVDHLGADIG